MEVSVNSLMVHTCTKKMLQLVLLVYAEENSINLNVCNIIIILISGTFTEFKKLFLKTDNTYRLYLNWFYQCRLVLKSPDWAVSTERTNNG